MKFTIDNLQGSGPVDYTAALDPTVTPRVERRLNTPAQFRCSVMANAPSFVTPPVNARIVVTRDDGTFVFTGYLTRAPQPEYLGAGQSAPVYRYELIAESDEILLDQKCLPNRAPYVNRTAGSALRQLAADLMPGAFDTSNVQDVDTLAVYTVNPQKSFSFHAAEISLSARASFRSMNAALILNPVGAATYEIDECDATFCAAGLRLESQSLVKNDITIVGGNEPQAYVRDYFVGDGLSSRFYLSQTPFQQSRPAIIDEEYAGAQLDATTWSVSDPASAISVAAQSLQVNGGTGRDGQTTVSFVEQIELGGAIELQHGDVSFSGTSQGILGGLYSGGISTAKCVAGFEITPGAGGTTIQALINGAVTGAALATTAGHRYILTTYVYTSEVYRSEQIYHSSVHAAGSGWGGTSVPADVRFVLEVQDVNPANPATLVAAATVLYDGVIPSAPGFCNYALVNASDMHCSISYTYVTHISLAEVRTALPNSDYVTQLVGTLSNGAQCAIASATSLDFYPQYVPPLNTLIVASYRGSGRAVAEVTNSASIASLQKGTDNGVRSAERTVKLPEGRTQTDCENAALALLDDSCLAAWSGTYQTWSDFLPSGAEDIFPGDGVAVNVASQNAEFSAIVRGVTIDVVDPRHDRGMYTIEFANDSAVLLAMHEETTGIIVPLQDLPARLTTAQVAAYYLQNLTDAQITEVTSTTVSVDAGLTPPSGFGIEVRVHDFGWGISNDRNLLGRFNTESFTLPRMARAQTYFMRLYDNSSPPRYSRYAAALHVDYPL